MSIIQTLAVGGFAPAADANSASIRAALPLSSQFGFNDQSHIIRSSGSPATVVNYYDIGLSNAISIQTAQSQFYGSSARKPTGANDNVYRESFLNVNTGVGTQAGTGDFCIEFWLYTESLTPPTGMDRLGVVFPRWRNNNADTFGYVPNIQIYSGGIRVMNPEETVTIAQTGTITTNAWQHIAITRSGTTLRVFVNGVQQASGSTSIDFTGYEYWFFASTRWYNFGFYTQDVRIYTGSAKYTSTFTPPGQMFI